MKFVSCNNHKEEASSLLTGTVVCLYCAGLPEDRTETLSDTSLDNASKARFEEQRENFPRKVQEADYPTS